MAVAFVLTYVLGARGLMWLVLVLLAFMPINVCSSWLWAARFRRGFGSRMILFRG
jgi:hypothetical protein